jgi:CRISPR-associated helicase Cas3
VRGGPRVTPDDIDERGGAAERDAFLEWRGLAKQDGDLPLWAKVALTHLATGSATVRVELTQSGPEGSNVCWRAQTKKSAVPRRALRELLGMPELRHAPVVDDSTESTTEGDEGSFLGSAISLPRHLAGVRDFAERFANALGLRKDPTGDLALSGWIHDLGKADTRFQLLLHGGDPVREAAACELLAKSADVATDRSARDRARERSGYPQGTRHELLSVALAHESAVLRERAHDWDLVLHLVASHHGWCRPFALPVLDPDPQMVSIDFDGTRLASSSAHGLERFDSAIPERFWMLVRRYGYWGLAWLEAVLRLADHRESESEAPKEEINDA